MHSTRKRRAASLTAEALWSFQMKDSVNTKKNQTSKNDSKKLLVGARSEGQKSSKSLTARRQSDTRKYKKKANVSGSSGSAIIESTKVHKVAAENQVQRKSKPTASVTGIPVKKSVNSIQWSTRNIPILENSVFLLPVSVNDTSLTSVPVLALHPSVNLKLVDCFGTSPSPVVDMHSLFNQRTSNSSLGHYLTRNNKRKPPTEFPGVSTLHSGDILNNNPSQTEPLNLKLGESSIPSFQNSNANSSKSSKKKTCKILPNIPFQEKFKQLTSHELSGKKISHRLLPKKREEKYEYTSYSPSSDSSYMSESDVSTHRSKRMRRESIDLRSMAAPIGTSTSLTTTSRKRSYSENNAWTWDGKPYYAMVMNVKTGRPVMRRCYPSMRRRSDNKCASSPSDSDEVIMVRDCVVLRADMSEQPYIAKVVALWEESSGSMMITLLWFYRPEHTEDPKVKADEFTKEELFASRHLDEISVACIEEKCYVLTYNSFCRYQASDDSREDHFGAGAIRDVVPPASIKNHSQPPSDLDLSLVFFCRRFYDVKSNRLLKQFPNPTALYGGEFTIAEKVLR